jgi:predicted nucleotidyltransferase
MKELTDILLLLAERGVDFVVVGGYAAAAYGSSLVTQDVDICCDFSPENLLRLQDALKEHHPVHRMTPKRLPLLLTPEGCRGLKNLYLETDVGQLDCLGFVLGVGDFQVVKQQSIPIDMDGVECRLIELETLIKAKKAMGRPRDLLAVQELEMIRSQIVDGEND